MPFESVNTELRSFNETEKHSWKTLFENLTECRRVQAHPLFSKGIEVLGFDGDHIPDLAKVNKTLKGLTGWQGVVVKGLDGPQEFFHKISQKQFPIGNFIRDAKDLAYTPEPDIFHDLYGHIPFYIDQDYGDFCQDFGRRALKYLNDPQILRQFERLFWFAVEFPLVKTNQGKRIFGGGILSSFTECNYSLSDKPEVRPFDIEDIRHLEYRIDQVQPVIYILEHPNQLYQCLEDFERGIYH